MHRYTLTLSKSLAIDAYKQINFLIAGARGSGKTYGALILITELASFPRLNSDELLGIGELPTQIYIVDFKNSDLARLGELLPSGRVATNKEEAIKVVSDYDEKMHKRLAFIKS